MIDSKELRIGNMVDLYGTTATIQKEDFNGKGIAIDKGKPIPITPELLKKAGFEREHSFKSNITFWNIRDDKYYFSLLYSEDSYSYNSPHFNVKYKYINEIQNLFHALTGKELTFKDL